MTTANTQQPDSGHLGSASAQASERFSHAALLEAGKEVEAAWMQLASALAQDDRVEALEWGPMQRLRAALKRAQEEA